MKNKIVKAAKDKIEETGFILMDNEAELLLEMSNLAAAQLGGPAGWGEGLLPADCPGILGK